MPTYEYKCDTCGHRWEVRQAIGDLPRAYCPECCELGHRVFSPPLIRFKGSGFYATDNRPPTKL
jgi:putative FmdB family regulatory protein